MSRNFDFSTYKDIQTTSNKEHKLDESLDFEYTDIESIKRNISKLQYLLNESPIKKVTALFPKRLPNNKYNRFREYNGNRSQLNSLDYSIILPKINRSKGAIIAPETMSTEVTNSSLGPGQYNPKYISASIPTPYFGLKLFRPPLKEPKTECYGLFLIKEKSSKKIKGFTFDQCPVDRNKNVMGMISPGPGYYKVNYEATKANPVSFFISSSVDASHAKAFKSKNTFDIQYVNPKSSLCNSDYQRFRKNERFPSKKRYSYSKVLLNLPDSNYPLIMRNKEQAKTKNFQTKLKDIMKNSTILSKRIRSVQETKNKLMKEREEHFAVKVKGRLRRILTYKERTLTSQVLSHWIILKTLTDWLKCCRLEYTIKKVIKHNTKKMVRVLFFSLLAIGKFRKKLYCIRLKRLSDLLKQVIRMKIEFWRKKRKKKYKRILGQFLIKYSHLSKFHLFVMQINKSITLLQRFYKRYLVKRAIMLSAMSIKWEKLELHNTTKTKNSVIPISIKMAYLKKEMNVF